MISQFQSGIAIGMLIGLAVSYFLFFINTIMEEKFKKREKKILENVKSYLNNKGGKKNNG